jgi:peptidoglycan hydrolase-like protein with peptidoglycan-binding domain
MAALIKPGSHGELVTGLQKKLKALGFELEPDGHFGPNTRAAVEDLQALFGYDVDGVVGDATEKLIAQQTELGFNLGTGDAVKRGLNAQGNHLDAAHRVLQKGSEGPDVRYVQRRLRALGHEVPIDGKFGPATEQAVRAMQTAFGYDVDGIVGAATHKLLNQQIGYGFRADKPAS